MKKAIHLTKFKGNYNYRPLFLLFSKRVIATTTMIIARRPPPAPPTYKDILLSAYASLFCFCVISEKKCSTFDEESGHGRTYFVGNE